VTYHPEYYYGLFHYELIFIFFIPSTLLLIKKYPQKALGENEFIVKLTRRNAYALVLFLLSFFVLTFHFTGSKNKGTIYLYQKGSFNWDLPTYSKFGALNGGMFGLLPEFLKDMNYSVVQDTVITQASLQNAHVLVFINLSNKLLSQEKQCIRDFINNGGSLLVLGDHTGDEIIRHPYNDLLEPFHIEFNFDSGIPFINHWDRGLEFKPHYITKRLKNNHDSHYGIGATLTIDNKSNPIIIGKYSFTDYGNMNNPTNGYLGDMLFSLDETAGDLVLAAEQSYGKGKILVFGDTSPFQNSEIVEDYKFLIDTFDYLSNPTYEIKNALIYSLMFLFMGLFLALYRQKIAISFLLILIVSGYATIVFNGMINQYKNDIHLNAKIAYIDKTHMERFNYDQWDPAGLGGTGFCFIRNGYFPLLLDQFDEQKISKSKILLLVAPAKPFTSREIEILDTYVRQGGFVILSCGWEECNSMKTLTEIFNVTILNIPLGKLESSQNSAMLSIPNAWAVQSKDNHSEILSQSSGYPVILFKRIYTGGLFLIGDSQFFLNNNIEGIYSYNINNILFLRNLLHKINN
jgi:hypothetical protein